MPCQPVEERRSQVVQRSRNPPKRLRRNLFLYSAVGIAVLQGGEDVKIDRPFKLKFPHQEEKIIQTVEDLAQAIAQLPERHTFTGAKVAFVVSTGLVSWIAPAKTDSRFNDWDKNQKIYELWNLVQRFLVIRVIEYKERIYLPPERGLGRVETAAHCSSF